MAARDSDRAWRRWGEIDPYYGVLADDRFRRDALADHRDEFWHLGDLQVTERIEVAERYFGALNRRRALDFGCGVGRLSLPLARHFGEIIGLDVAPAMLAEARRNAQEAGIANLRVASSDDAISKADGHFDFVISCIVLQHIPVRRGMRIVRALLEKVAQGGVVTLQICVDRGDTPAQAMRYWAQCHVPGIHALFNIARGRPVGEPFMQMNAYSTSEIEQLAASLGFGAAIIDTVAHGRFMTAQLLMRRETIQSC